jgi:tRNA(Ile)-lysidine synthase
MTILDPVWLEKASEKKWLVAVSGGRDSIALLHACATDPRLTGSNSLVICHVNHQLRGAESDADEELVRNLAVHYQLPIVVHKTDVSLLAKDEKKSIELAARDFRHAVFSCACEEHQCDAVLLAHHADDQSETALYNLLRGSAGLKAMQKETHLTEKKLTLVRPILHLRRSEINDYISEHKLSYREDVTNAEPFAIRNRLRNEAIPLLSEILGRDIAASILKSVQHSEQNEHFIQQMIDYPSMLDPQGRLHLPSLTEAPQIIQQRILHRYLTEQKISNITQDLIESCLSLLDPSNPAKINLPGGKFFRRKERRIFVSE